jgi:sulfide:quinone oxidoreductase
MYLAEDYFRRHGLRDRARVLFVSAGKQIFGIEKYRKTLEKIIAQRGIECLFRHELVAVRPETSEAVFINLDTKQEHILPYAMLHVTPPMSAPDFIAHSPLADTSGWLDVDKHTLRHVRYENVFGIGDCINVPTGKTGAAIRKQAPVLVKNLLAARSGQPLPARYNGYSSCPLITSYGRVVLAEFDYSHEPVETFPFDQSKPRYSMWLLKRYVLPLLYWYGMLKGRA